MKKMCEICGNTFKISPYRAATARFCSRACKGKGIGAPHFKTMTTKPWNIGNTFRAGKKPTNAFHAGHVPWNKNLKGIHLSPSSEFVAGRAQPSDPIGTVRLRTHRCVVRAWVKIAMPSTWQLRAVVNFESHHGIKVPAGRVIHHIDRVTTNDHVDNLLMVTKSEHASIHRAELIAARALHRKHAAAAQQGISD